VEGREKIEKPLLKHRRMRSETLTDGITVTSDSPRNPKKKKNASSSHLE
jgi:hypothetical protein